jgi:hypothetical protein
MGDGVDTAGRFDDTARGIEMAKRWRAERTERVERGRTPDAQRLTDLSLALVVPWPDGYPQYVGPMDSPDGWTTILNATKNIRLPWEL